MARPVIGITCSKYNPATGGDSVQVARLSTPLAYPEAVEAAGGVPMLLPRSDDPEVVASAMARVDGLLLSGGGDVGALLFGAEPHPSIKLVDPVRDNMEIEATGIAMERGIPILGICRGAQVLAVACGGDLVQDIPSAIPNAVQHQTAQSETGVCHTIEIEADSLLARVLGRTRTAVNSTHHQAVGRPGHGMRIVARALDGVVEGIEALDGAPVLGVQCHPESNYRQNADSAALFRWLVGQAAGHRAGGF